MVKGKLLLDLTEEDVKEYGILHYCAPYPVLTKYSTFGSNTIAHFWVLKAFLPAMLRRGRGHIVTVSSLLGLVGCAQMSKSQLPSSSPSPS